MAGSRNGQNFFGDVLIEKRNAGKYGPQDKERSKKPEYFFSPGLFPECIQYTGDDEDECGSCFTT